MSACRRYAIYYVPPSGPLAELGAAWLGWDLATGRAVSHLDPEGLPRSLPDLTRLPRRYGFHATIRPPFALPPGMAVERLAQTARDICAAQAPVVLDGLATARMGPFVALRPMGDTTASNALAATVVRALDAFRPALTDADLARRRRTRLTATQDALLVRWGYPHVMEAFGFHMTLTGPLNAAAAAQARAAAAALFDAAVPAPLRIDSLALVGEDEAGRFHLIERLPLRG